jgi:hypothetical protein
MAAAENKKQVCATTVSSKDGFGTFVLKGFPPNMAPENMSLQAASAMVRENGAKMVGDAKPAGFRCPRIPRNNKE